MAENLFANSQCPIEPVDKLDFDFYVSCDISPAPEVGSAFTCTPPLVIARPASDVGPRCPVFLADSQIFSGYVDPDCDENKTSVKFCITQRDVNPCVYDANLDIRVGIPAPPCPEIKVGDSTVKTGFSDCLAPSIDFKITSTTIPGNCAEGEAPKCEFEIALDLAVPVPRTPCPTINVATFETSAPFSGYDYDENNNPIDIKCVVDEITEFCLGYNPAFFTLKTLIYCFEDPSKNAWAPYYPVCGTNCPDPDLSNPAVPPCAGVATYAFLDMPEAGWIASGTGVKNNTTVGAITYPPDRLLGPAGAALDGWNVTFALATDKICFNLSQGITAYNGTQITFTDPDDPRRSVSLPIENAKTKGTKFEITTNHTAGTCTEAGQCEFNVDLEILTRIPRTPCPIISIEQFNVVSGLDVAGCVTGAENKFEIVTKHVTPKNCGDPGQCQFDVTLEIAVPIPVVPCPVINTEFSFGASFVGAPVDNICSSGRESHFYITTAHTAPTCNNAGQCAFDIDLEIFVPIPRTPCPVINEPELKIAVGHAGFDCVTNTQNYFTITSKHTQPQNCTDPGQCEFDVALSIAVPIPVMQCPTINTENFSVVTAFTGNDVDALCVPGTGSQFSVTTRHVEPTCTKAAECEFDLDLSIFIPIPRTPCPTIDVNTFNVVSGYVGDVLDCLAGAENRFSVTSSYVEPTNCSDPGECKFEIDVDIAVPIPTPTCPVINSTFFEVTTTLVGGLNTATSLGVTGTALNGSTLSVSSVNGIDVGMELTPEGGFAAQDPPTTRTFTNIYADTESVYLPVNSTAGLSVGMAVSWPGMPPGTNVNIVGLWPAGGVYPLPRVVLSSAVTLPADNTNISFQNLAVGGTRKTSAYTGLGINIPIEPDASGLSVGMAVSGYGIPADPPVTIVQISKVGNYDIVTLSSAVTLLNGSAIGFQPVAPGTKVVEVNKNNSGSGGTIKLSNPTAVAAGDAVGLLPSASAGPDAGCTGGKTNRFTITPNYTPATCTEAPRCEFDIELEVFVPVPRTPCPQILIDSFKVTSGYSDTCDINENKFEILTRPSNPTACGDTGSCEFGLTLEIGIPIPRAPCPVVNLTKFASVVGFSDSSCVQNKNSAFTITTAHSAGAGCNDPGQCRYDFSLELYVPIPRTPCPDIAVNVFSQEVYYENACARPASRFEITKQVTKGGCDTPDKCEYGAELELYIPIPLPPCPEITNSTGMVVNVGYEGTQCVAGKDNRFDITATVEQTPCGANRCIFDIETEITVPIPLPPCVEITTGAFDVNIGYSTCVAGGSTFEVRKVTTPPSGCDTPETCSYAIDLELNIPIPVPRCPIINAGIAAAARYADAPSTVGATAMTVTPSHTPPSCSDSGQCSFDIDVVVDVDVPRPSCPTINSVGVMRVGYSDVVPPRITFITGNGNITNEGTNSPPECVYSNVLNIDIGIPRPPCPNINITPVVNVLPLGSTPSASVSPSINLRPGEFCDFNFELLLNIPESCYPTMSALPGTLLSGPQYSNFLTPVVHRNGACAFTISTFATVKAITQCPVFTSAVNVQNSAGSSSSGDTYIPIGGASFSIVPGGATGGAECVYSLNGDLYGNNLYFGDGIVFAGSSSVGTTQTRLVNGKVVTNVNLSISDCPPDGGGGGGGGCVEGPQGATGPQGPIGPQGPRGFPGMQGPAGMQGPQGAAGPQGATGQKGDKGNTGQQGPQGIAGPKGDKGDDGDPGATGPTGASGVTGATGATGCPGIAGPQGAQGLTGVTGPTGPRGLQGDQGIKGDTGATGVTGPQGATGIEGPAGVKGDTGTQGATGAQGPAGARGAKGEQGAQGATGVTGPAGLTGSAGATGPRGATGLMGATGVGAAGPAGAQGPRGLTGPPGATGPQGPTGPIGATGIGERGPEGPVGAPGPAGPQGVAGQKGDKGDTGAIGPRGPQGVPGPPGQRGANGVGGQSGATGATGAVGPTGQIGATGVQGPIGLQGKMGATGPRGATGALGATGPAPRVLPTPDPSVILVSDRSGAFIELHGITGATGPAPRVQQTNDPNIVKIIGGRVDDPTTALLEAPIGATGATGPCGLTGQRGPAGPGGPPGMPGTVGATGPTGPKATNEEIATALLSKLQSDAAFLNAVKTLLGVP